MWSSSRKRITSLYGKHQRAVTSKKIWYNPSDVTFVQLNIRRANISIPLFSVIFFGTNDGDGAMFVSPAVCLHSIFTSCLKCSFIRSSRFVAGSFRADRFCPLISPGIWDASRNLSMIHAFTPGIAPVCVNERKAYLTWSHNKFRFSRENCAIGSFSDSNKNPIKAAD